MDVLKATVTTKEGITGAIESIGGYLKDDKKEGCGILYLPSGEKYKGEWKNDQREDIHSYKVI